MRLTITTLALALAFCSGASAPAQDTGTSVPEAAPVQTVATPPRVIRISGGVAAGNILTKVPPVYPPDAKAQGVSGTVVLHAIIARDGTVQELSVVAGNELLQKAALDAVRQWTYRPYLLNGNPVAVDTTITVNFNLTGAASTPLTGSTPVTETMANGDTETIKVVNQTAAAQPPERIRVPAGVMEKNIISKVQPTYPKDGSAAGVSGMVILVAYISADGGIEKLQAISGPAPLRQAAIDAAQHWVYKPYLLNGNPVAIQTTITMNFIAGQ